MWRLRARPCGVWRLRARACAYLARACMRCTCSVNVCVRDVCAGEELLESPFPEESWGRPRPWPLPLCRVGLRPGDLGARLTPRLSSPPLQGAHCPEPRRLPPTSWVWVPRPLGRTDSAPVRSGREAGRWRSALDTLPPARPQDARPGRAASCAPVPDQLPPSRRGLRARGRVPDPAGAPACWLTQRRGFRGRWLTGPRMVAELCSSEKRHLHGERGSRPPPRHRRRLELTGLLNH